MADLIAPSAMAGGLGAVQRGVEGNIANKQAALQFAAQVAIQNSRDAAERAARLKEFQQKNLPNKNFFYDEPNYLQNLMGPNLKILETELSKLGKQKEEMTKLGQDMKPEDLARESRIIAMQDQVVASQGRLAALVPTLAQADPRTAKAAAEIVSAPAGVLDPYGVQKSEWEKHIKAQREGWQAAGLDVALLDRVANAVMGYAVYEPGAPPPPVQRTTPVGIKETRNSAVRAGQLLKEKLPPGPLTMPTGNAAVFVANSLNAELETIFKTAFTDVEYRNMNPVSAVNRAKRQALDLFNIAMREGGYDPGHVIQRQAIEAQINRLAHPFDTNAKTIAERAGIIRRDLDLPESENVYKKAMDELGIENLGFTEEEMPKPAPPRLGPPGGGLGAPALGAPAGAPPAGLMAPSLSTTPRPSLSPTAIPSPTFTQTPGAGLRSALPPAPPLAMPRSALLPPKGVPDLRAAMPEKTRNFINALTDGAYMPTDQLQLMADMLEGLPGIQELTEADMAPFSTFRG